MIALIRNENFIKISGDACQTWTKNGIMQKELGVVWKKLQEKRQVSCDLSSFKTLEMFLLECDSMHLPCVRDRCEFTSDYSIKLLLLVICIPHETCPQCRACPMIIHVISCDSS